MAAKDFINGRFAKQPNEPVINSYVTAVDIYATAVTLVMMPAVIAISGEPQTGPVYTGLSKQREGDVP